MSTQATPRICEPGAYRLLDTYQPYHAAHADLLRRAGGRLAEATAAYASALALCCGGPERRFIARRLAALRAERPDVGSGSGR